MSPVELALAFICAVCRTVSRTCFNYVCA